MVRSSSCRDDPNHPVGFSVGNHQESLIEKAKRQESRFRVLEPVVLVRERGTREEKIEVGEINAVLREIRSPLAFVPLEFHGDDRNYVA